MQFASGNDFIQLTADALGTEMIQVPIQGDYQRILLAIGTQHALPPVSSNAREVLPYTCRILPRKRSSYALRRKTVRQKNLSLDAKGRK